MTPEYLDDLAALALDMVGLIRDDRDAAHRTVARLSHLELEQLACVLAAMVDPDKPMSELAWWRLLDRPDMEDVA